MKSRMSMEAQNKLLSVKILSPREGHFATWANCETDHSKVATRDFAGQWPFLLFLKMYSH